MHLEEFAEGLSLWHRMDPRVKVVGAALFAVVVAVSHNLQALAVALGLALACLLSARLNVKQVLIRLAAVNFFVGGHSRSSKRARLLTDEIRLNYSDASRQALSPLFESPRAIAVVALP